MVAFSSVPFLEITLQKLMRFPEERFAILALKRPQHFKAMNGLTVRYRLRTSVFCAHLSILPVVLLAVVSAGPPARGAGATWTRARRIPIGPNGANWTGSSEHRHGGVPGAADNVVFGTAGEATTATSISNYLDSTSGNFGGTIGSLQYTNSANFQNTLIAIQPSR